MCSLDGPRVFNVVYHKPLSNGRHSAAWVHPKAPADV